MDYQLVIDPDLGISAASLGSAVRLLVESGAEVASVETARESLEEIFLKLVEEDEAEATIA